MTVYRPAAPNGSAVLVCPGGAYRILDYAVSASHFESNGQFTNDSADQNAGNLRLGLTLPWQSSLTVAVCWNKTDIGAPVRGVFGGPQPIEPSDCVRPDPARGQVGPRAQRRRVRASRRRHQVLGRNLRREVN